ncbi:MAG: DUF5658 family protein [Gammaproteobacteria bacterium]
MNPGQQKFDSRAIEQRDSNRRNPSLSTLQGALFLNRRRLFRRGEDHVNSYKDWHGHLPLAATLLIILLCFADAFLTTVLLDKGAVEMNVFMNWLIQKDIHAFTIVKMALTGTALLVLVFHYNFMIYRYIAVKYVMFALVPAYMLLILHELNMLANF